ncbi:MAG TPA: hypothetical protein VNR00_15150, partial [Opitutus sp.]|nr:hypothetical protein [Opitutus sp.]
MMRSSDSLLSPADRGRVWTMVGLGLVAMLAILPHVLVRREMARQFVPGELGREPASPLAADRAALSPRAYLTRAL